jgi:muramoyltetrapeptide carboxypeptidase
VSLRKPHALRPGDRVAVVAPASGFPVEEFQAGLDELRALGFEPVHDESVFAVDAYEAGPPAVRAGAIRQALADPAVSAILCVRGGYGSVKVLPLLDPALVHSAAKPIVGYSDVTSLLTFCTQRCGLVAMHGPMLAGRLSRGEAGYDRVSFVQALTGTHPLGDLSAPRLEAILPGDATGELRGGNLTQLAASLGTPFAFDPPAGHVLFLEDVNERPYRIDRMLTQLHLAGVLARASGIVFGEMVGCDEPGGGPAVRDVVRHLLADFRGPVLFGFPSGHTHAPAVTLPLGVRARVVSGTRPALVIEEAAVSL